MAFSPIDDLMNYRKQQNFQTCINNLIVIVIFAAKILNPAKPQWGLNPSSPQW
jgi:hypothetical protein